MARVIDELHGAIRLPLRGLIAVTAVLGTIVVVILSSFLIKVAAIALYNVTGPIPLVVFFSLPILYGVLAWLGSIVEDGHW